MLYVSSPNLATNTATLQQEIAIVQTKLHAAGLDLDVEKSELMHFTTKRNPARPNVVIQGEGEGSTPTTIEPCDTMRWLGIFFDRKLLFNAHVKEIAARAERITLGLSMLANTIRGLPQARVRQLYIACVRSVMSYASPVWWTGKKTHANLLERVQRRWSSEGKRVSHVTQGLIPM
ncbi:hypothetical protein CONPUDRAFT_52536 [Coniophora puteana RWD-64-598 SS2]|uniref:Reverse transcriptase domain-containing protein n=1 Tax=Coniophora puteana (strain RWD-64-598) TaxID=741705 RepID=A0A5M3MWF8_CONPW|nr:uncharacterized protein CONPUDRAFT_52536 [Coniophora puteana RWD-64-598 SS2]EIW83488.1 hypothetical protein CONPUDRAFT_52536 [Coniophora puteana RWD-64-598 SS2]